MVKHMQEGDLVEFLTQDEKYLWQRCIHEGMTFSPSFNQDKHIRGVSIKPQSNRGLNNFAKVKHLLIKERRILSLEISSTFFPVPKLSK